LVAPRVWTARPRFPPDRLRPSTGRLLGCYSRRQRWARLDLGARSLVRKPNL